MLTSDKFLTSSVLSKKLFVELNTYLILVDVL